LTSDVQTSEFKRRRSDASSATSPERSSLSDLTRSWLDRNRSIGAASLKESNWCLMGHAERAKRHFGIVIGGVARIRGSRICTEVKPHWIVVPTSTGSLRHGVPVYGSGDYTIAKRQLVVPEPVKRNETLSYDAFCRTSSSVTGSLIHARVGSFGGSGLRLWNRVGLPA